MLAVYILLLGSTIIKLIIFSREKKYLQLTMYILTCFINVIFIMTSLFDIVFHFLNIEKKNIFKLCYLHLFLAIIDFLSSLIDILKNFKHII